MVSKMVTQRLEKKTADIVFQDKLYDQLGK